MNNQTLFNALGFKWDRSKIPSIIPIYTVECRGSLFPFYEKFARIYLERWGLRG